MEARQRTLFEQPAEPADETRDAAYRQVAAREAVGAAQRESGLGDAQQRVFDVIRRNTDVTNSEIARLLGWEINRVTGRTKELRDRGLVEKGRRRACQVTGQVVQAWKAVVQDPRLSVNPCVQAWGFGPKGVRCEACAHLVVKQAGNRYYKCVRRGATNGPGTDHRVGWPACGKFEARSGEGPTDLQRRAVEALARLCFDPRGQAAGFVKGLQSMLRFGARTSLSPKQSQFLWALVWRRRTDIDDEELIRTAKDMLEVLR